jgi:hypothetical protein
MVDLVLKGFRNDNVFATPGCRLRLDSHSIATATASEMSCHLPLRFRSSGQTKSAESVGN